MINFLTSNQSTADESGPPKKRRVESILESFITEIKEEKQKERQDKEQRRIERIEERTERIERQNQMHKDRTQFQQSLIELLTKIVDRK